MRVRDLNSWPPKWGSPGRSKKGQARIEAAFILRSDAGTLKAVRWGPKKAYLSLTILHGGEEWSGALQDDPVALQKLYALLSGNIGQSLSDIVALELTPQLLPPTNTHCTP